MLILYGRYDSHETKSSCGCRVICHQGLESRREGERAEPQDVCMNYMIYLLSEMDVMQKGN